jgi:hypothetical protein
MRWLKIVLTALLLAVAPAAAYADGDLYLPRNWSILPGAGTVPITDCGAVPDDGVDDTTAITTCISLAATQKKTLLIPSGTFLISSTLTFTKPAVIQGRGKALSKIQLAAGFTGDVIKLAPAVGEFVGFWAVRDLYIEPTNAGDGGNAIEIDATAGTSVSLEHLDISGVQVGLTLTVSTYRTVGGYAVHLTKHPTDPDNYYTSVIRDNYFVGGINLVGAGDSLWIERNTIKGSQTAIHAEFIAGAANVHISDNSLTATGGAIYLKTALNASITNNQIEQLSPWTGDSNRAMVVLEDSNGTRLAGNNINAELLTSDGADDIRLLGTTKNITIEGNRLVTNSANGWFHVKGDAGISNVIVQNNNLENPYNTPVTAAVTSLTASTWRPGAAIIDSFAANGTWTKRSGVQAVYAACVGGGGGGGGGARTASGSASSGGGGGGGGSFAEAWLDPAALGSTETVTIGSAGTGGNGATADANAGSNGTAGGVATFGVHLKGWAGGLGAGGQLAGNSGGGGGAGSQGNGGDASGATAGPAGSIGGVIGGTGAVGNLNNSIVGAGSGAGGTSAAAGNLGGASGAGAGGGGSGGGIATTPVGLAGGNSGLSKGRYVALAGGTAGNPGTAVGAVASRIGSGGPGGGSNAAGVGGAGATGGLYGGGGGGGGSAVGGNGGRGGDGGPAACWVRSQF